LWDVAVNPDTGEVSETFVCPFCETPWRKAQLQRLRSDPVEVTYECPRCKPKRSTDKITDEDKDLISIIEAKEIPYWYPTKEFDKEGEQYKRDALHLRNIRTIADFYTKRNLWALACLHSAVAQTTNESLKSHLSFWLTSINWLASKMYRYRVDGGGGQQGRLTISALSREQNVLRLALEKAEALEHLLRESMPGDDYCVVNTGSATNLMDCPGSSVDYVFTDPPFGSNLYYDDLNFLWEGWLGQFTDSTFEAVVHRARKVNPKTLDDYAQLMTESFREMYRVLKPGRWASVVFHNSDDRVWRAIQQAAEDAGFDLVNATMFDKEQRSFKGTRGEKGLENVTNFDIVLNLHKKSEAQPVAQPEAHDRIERLIVSAVDEHLRSGPAPDYRTGQYLHSLALRTLLNEKISIELTWEQLDRLLQQYFRHINCHWYLPKEAVTTRGHGILVLGETGAISWLEHVLSASPQTISDLIPQWQIATLGAGSRIKRTLEELLKENFWLEENTGLWCMPNAVQREMLKRRRTKPQQLTLGLEAEGGPQKKLDL
jgi:16S rRNA G966 N2-methylase RsmD